MVSFANPVLLVEDNPVDILTISKAWKIAGIKNKLHVVKNGEEALQFLFRKEKHENVPMVCLILLDLNMPKMNGFEILKTIRENDGLKNIPIIILTSSSRDKDIKRAYQLGCNSYIMKPSKYKSFVEIISMIKLYWLTINKIPV